MPTQYGKYTLARIARCIMDPALMGGPEYIHIDPAFIARPIFDPLRESESLCLDLIAFVCVEIELVAIHGLTAEQRLALLTRRNGIYDRYMMQLRLIAPDNHQLRVTKTYHTEEL